MPTLCLDGALLGMITGAAGSYLIFVICSILAGGLITWWVENVARKNGVPSDRVALSGMWIAMLIIFLPGWFLVKKANESEKQTLQGQLEAFARTYAEGLGEMDHHLIRDASSANDPVYLAIIEKQKQWLELNPLVSDIYTFRKDPGGNRLIVDSETDYNGDGKFDSPTEARTEIGEIWLEESVMLDLAYEGEAVFDDEPYKDRWGEWVSAYVPMKDEAGKVDAVLGVDFPAEQWKQSMKRARLTVIGLLGVVITLVLGAGAVIAILRSSLLERRLAAQRLREAKVKVDEANQALETSNRDLEQFAYVASHDLQEPLRMVTSFLQLIQKRYGGELGKDADEYIRHAVEGADRMRRLINGLLELSRLNRKERRFEPVDVGKVVEVAVDNLSVVIWERGAKIKREELPIVLGDEAQLIQLFQNLIGNAIKFCQDETPVIEIEARLVVEEDSDWWVFSVTDNGPGIAAEHHERIYEIFQRLQPSSQGGGTGIGLALCRRIVETHGGEITLQSEVGEGCVFKFNLKSAPENGVVGSDDGDQDDAAS